MFKNMDEKFWGKARDGGKLASSVGKRRRKRWAGPLSGEDGDSGLNVYVVERHRRFGVDVVVVVAGKGGGGGESLVLHGGGCVGRKGACKQFTN